ncbi:MAG: hypothetical protein ACI9BW_001819 [Gammaproteobacteria bacterium]
METGGDTAIQNSETNAMDSLREIEKEINPVTSRPIPLATDTSTAGLASNWGIECTTIANSGHDFISNQKEIDEIFRAFRS